MTTWRLRSPGRFPATFHRAVERCLELCQRHGIGEEVLLCVEGREEGLTFTEKFRYFRYCLRGHPLHPLHYAERDYYLRTRMVSTREGFEIRLTIRAKPRLDALRKVLEKL